MSKAAELANLIGNINAGGGGVNRNVIINGAMNVSQRGTSFNQPNDAYTLDRFAAYVNGDGKLDVEQSTTVPSGEGFKNSLKCTVDTVDTSLGSSDFGMIGTKIEGQDLTRFDFGQSTAKQFVLSFFVRSNITGTYSVAFRNGSANRYLVKEYTISSADTWQKITITNLADNTGTWATDNTTGLDLRWCLWEGGFSASADTWGAGNIIGSSSNVNWATSTDNNWYITGVQLEVGQNATEFEHEPFGETLQKCQRYYYSLPDTPTSSFRICHLAHVKTASFGNSGFNHPTPMRTQPTVTENGTLVMHDGGSARDYAIGANYSTTTTVATNITTASFANTPQSGTVENNSNASNFLTIEAEL
jgi:hypothetical protein